MILPGQLCVTVLNLDGIAITSCLTPLSDLLTGERKPVAALHFINIIPFERDIIDDLITQPLSVTYPVFCLPSRAGHRLPWHHGMGRYIHIYYDNECSSVGLLKSDSEKRTSLYIEKRQVAIYF